MLQEESGCAAPASGTRCNSPIFIPLIVRNTLRESVLGFGKSLLGWLIYNTRFYRFFRRDEAVIVLFHRVNDAYPNDPLTYVSGKFESFVRFFGRFFKVVPLTTLLDRLDQGADIGGLLAITFDDGYVGNATIAAPILEKYNERACFFVTTDWIESKHVPWWDKEKDIDTEWMTWEQVRALRERGHDVGSHTLTHPDLGVVPPEVARTEIAGGAARLDSELGEHSGLFAYPFGGRKNMSPQNQDVVNTLGLRCCLSAFGGTVRIGDDPLRLKRITISDWFRSPYQFGFELLSGSLDAD
jgi:peptidoglycan/xylan/chitin deacetylase (PgdA/CDA1 family)